MINIILSFFGVLIILILFRYNDISREHAALTTVLVFMLLVNWLNLMDIKKHLEEKER